ncbi:molybdenum cofactor biosynthesis protein [Kyrpidia spormannii]|uniref:Molybdenum cofactor biosynthesis protein n=3 Tax=Kyrpidia TaxID=1129704 RepID=A0A2K8N753_9BACL|nr:MULTISPECIES: MogA/MoaB family molybdenum cofactor biosynthesis protein [Kyrpidia]ADG06028.1 molybdenum cofactor synthesis domain protein [Kyrpidia tusciae DSM 2912]ATY85174.1 molybdenum cofactor biosynthesis protein [Kyrpidia spormannii]CAB3392862.1 Molybdopterin adenylyltransferase [Kyrpidia spormannii]CAB3393780.1 Molybdopterin adenylyltransferase [Kyrpidia spormannii]
MSEGWTVAIVTCSDKGAKGERPDTSGEVIRDYVTGRGMAVRGHRVVPDERDQIEAALVYYCDVERVDLVLTTGGTGLGPRDVTPEATLTVVERLVPGIPERMRAATAAVTPTAILSRSVAGIRGQTLIVNLPGNPKGVQECLEAVGDVLPHALGVLSGRVRDHGPVHHRHEESKR